MLIYGITKTNIDNASTRVMAAPCYQLGQNVAGCEENGGIRRRGAAGTQVLEGRDALLLFYFEKRSHDQIHCWGRVMQVYERKRSSQTLLVFRLSDPSHDYRGR
ncbi:unnamed protein product [Laminaria digitata]